MFVSVNYFNLTSLFVSLFFTVYGEEFLGSDEIGDGVENCGRTRFKSKEPQSKVPGKAAVGQFPWFVRVGYYYHNKKSIKKNKTEVAFICDGSIIGKLYVVTASRCAMVARMVRAGDYDLQAEIDCDECDNECAPPHQDIDVFRSFVSNQCTNKTNEIAILELKNSLEFNDFVNSICVPTKPRITFKWTSGAFRPKFGFIVGLGTNNYLKNTLHKNKLYVKRPETKKEEKKEEEKKNEIDKNYAVLMNMNYVNPSILDKGDCNKLYIRKLLDSQLCIGYSKEERGTCMNSNIGGGYIHHKKDFYGDAAFLAGVATHELSNCIDGEAMPVVYTDVGYFAEWVARTIKDAFYTRGVEDENVNGTKVPKSTRKSECCCCTKSNKTKTHPSV